MQPQSNKKRLTKPIAIGIIVSIVIIIGIIITAIVLSLPKHMDDQASGSPLPHTLPSDEQPKSSPLDVASRKIEEKILKRVRNNERTAELYNLSKSIDMFIYENNRIPDIKDVDYEPGRPLEITDAGTGSPETDVIIYTKNIACDGSPLEAGYNLTTYIEDTESDKLEKTCKDGRAN